MKPVVCIMAKNEAESIGEMIAEAKKLKIPFFVCDGNSTDGTLEIAEKKKAKILRQRGKGKGSGMREAMSLARQKKFSAIVFIDCDMTYPVEMIPRMLEVMRKQECGMVLGRRDSSNIPSMNRLPNAFFNWLVRRLFGCRIMDMLTGLRAVSLEGLHEQELSASGFDIETELTLRAIKKGLRVVEIPIDYYPRKGKSKISKKDGFVILSRLVREKVSV
jgi:dolichol-phosphate mannosyltransferase